MKQVLIFVEQKNPEDAVNLLEVAREIYDHEGYKTFAAVINSDIPGIYGYFDYILEIGRDIQEYDHIAISDVIFQMYEKYKFDCIMFSATFLGRMIAPMVAVKINTGLVADVTEISKRENDFLLMRPAYGGRIMAGIKVSGGGPVMLSVRPSMFNYNTNKKVRSILIMYKDISYKKNGIKILNKKEKEINYDIRDSNILISGGAGVFKNFDAIKPLAKELRGQVSASKAVVEKGILPRNYQVGQSGKTVSPSLYIALGIFGAIQHVVGLKDVDYIVSVNTNKKAPICSMSDIVVEGDAFTFVKKILERINKGKGK